MAASLNDKRTPITTPPYQVPSVDVTPDPPIFSLVTTFKQRKNPPKYTCHDRFRNNFQNQSQVPGTSFTVTGGFLNAARSSLKRVPERLLKISKLL
jgi:hypothetical protein